MPLGIGLGNSPELLSGGGNINVSPATAIITVVGKAPRITLLAVESATVTVTGKTISPILIPGKATVAVTGRAISPILIPGKATITITGYAPIIGTGGTDYSDQQAASILYGMAW